MKRVATIAAMVLLWLSASGKLLVAQSPEPVANPPQPAGVKIDLRNKLPAQLDLIVGQNIVFENGSARVAADETDGNGKLFQPRPHNAFNPPAAFRTIRDGKGEITVTFPAQGQLTVVRTEKIAVTVKKPVVTGVEGTAIKAPIRANRQPKPGAKVKNEAPVANATIVVKDDKGKEVARSTSDADGKFGIDLPPGKYTIESDHPQKGPAGFPRGFRGSIEIRAGERLQLDIRYDTGIR